MGADRDGILKKLQGYMVNPEDDPEAWERRPAQLFSFKEGGFYDTVVKRVRKEFGATTDKLDESVSINVKANHEWTIKVATQVFLNLFFYALAFILPVPMAVSIPAAFLAGMFQIQWGFTAFHDASHFALGKRNYWLNDKVCRVWAAWSLWHGRVWNLHHVALHHSYTGNPALDPDVQHATPMVRKTPDTPERKDNGLFQMVGDRFGMMGWAAIAVLIYVFLPGMWFGQARVYAMYRLASVPWLREYLPQEVLKSTRLWGMPKYEDVHGFETEWWEYVIFGAQILFQLLKFNPIVSFCYAISLNFWYSMCIVADHDLAESAVTNHIDFEPTHVAHDGHGVDDISPSGEAHEVVPDWGEMQVRNTTNFVNSKLNLFGKLNGNINFQVEHHLFPGMSHMFLPKTAPIVRETCEEFGIPYTTYPTLTDAWWSFLITLRPVMTHNDNTVEELKEIRHLW